MQDWARKIAGGDLRALARAATGIENRDPASLALLHEMAPLAGGATVVGITGPPGAGKSTLLDALARAIRQRDRTVAIIAVDPSSHVSGGAILGDRIRMQAHHADPGIFIRSMATRGSVGGLAKATGDLALLFDAAGKDFVLIETVGVGQDEVEIARLAGVTVVVLVPGMGDDVQAIKAGIMEIADVFVINKADHPGVERMEREIQGMLSLANRYDGWVPPIVRTVATDGKGVVELLEAVSNCHEFRLKSSPQRREYTIDRLGASAQPLTDSLPLYEEWLGRGAVLHHVALRVPDLNAVVERLRAAGVRLLDDPRANAEGNPYVFVHPASTGGVLLELIQEKKI